MSAAHSLVVGQSGGPTAVINASLAGVLDAAHELGVERVLGMRFGIEGLLSGDLVDLTHQPRSFVERLRTTPSAILGSCRYKLKTADTEQALTRLRQVQASYLIYIGGNDSADTSHQIHQAAAAAGYDLAVVGVPKTIDNDLPRTDHCPGYGSAARFIAQTTAEIGLDTAAMRRTDPIKLLEVMGRHAGWLAAASWLGKRDEADAPHLVYLPERPIAEEEMLADVEQVYRRLGYCVAVLCENQTTPGGSVIGAHGEPRWTDAFGNRYFNSPAEYLADTIRRRLGARARVDRPGTVQRMSTAHLSSTDLREAAAAGRCAVELALAGSSDIMVTLVRDSEEPYVCSTGQAPLSEIASQQRLLPTEFVDPDGRSPSLAFARYAGPLLGEPLPRFARL